jgi:hypothetical protein
MILRIAHARMQVTADKVRIPWDRSPCYGEGSLARSTSQCKVRGESPLEAPHVFDMLVQGKSGDR